MELSSRGAAFVRRHEGFVGKWYRDPVGIGTIGIGFTWGSGAFREWWATNRPGQKFGPGATMTRAEADDALRFLMSKEYGAAVSRFLGRDVPQHVYDGMASPVFNLGPGSLDWRWAAAARRGAYDECADILRTTGTTARGKRLPGLVRRRGEEADLIEHGDYGDAGPPLVVADPMEDGILMRGERGEPVKALQDGLTKLGHYAGELDGIFGPGTEAAVMAFQRSAGLIDDGYAGPKTLSALRVANDPVSAPATTVTEPPNPIAIPVPKARPELAGKKTEEVVEVLLREGSRTIQSTEILKAIAKLKQLGGALGITSLAPILAFAGSLPTWAWFLIAVVGVVVLGLFGLTFYEKVLAKTIERARADDAITGKFATGGPS